MFYLKCFFSLLRQNMISGGLFLFSTLFVVFMFGQVAWVNDVIVEILEGSVSGDYFYCLIPAKENAGWVSRKLLDVPDVQKVQTVDRSKIDAEAKGILSSAGLEGLDSVFQMDYVALRVTFTTNLSSERQEDVRTYLRRLVADHAVVMGAVKSSQKDVRRHGVIAQIIVSYGVYIIVGFGLAIWFFSLMLLSRSAAQMSYLIEQYQRRKRVRGKIILSGFLVVFVISFVITVLYRTPNLLYMGLAILLVVPVCFSGVGKCVWDS